LVIFLFDLPISIRPRSGLKGSDRWLTERFHRFGQQRLIGLFMKLYYYHKNIMDYLISII
ncbi:hypothetical protein, partial [Vibrio parahaemolyticus]|uniref:hypothetical protein n=1 Tax=Vibrio parahaemolyticus TaxID=670 RepID=UPI00235E5191